MLETKKIEILEDLEFDVNFIGKLKEDNPFLAITWLKENNFSPSDAQERLTWFHEDASVDYRRKVVAEIIMREDIGFYNCPCLDCCSLRETFEKSENLYFQDAQERYKENPNSVSLPSNEELEKLVPGILIQLVYGIEIFYVLVKKVEGDKVEGIIDTELKFSKKHFLVKGKEVELEKRHIHKILSNEYLDSKLT